MVWFTCDGCQDTIKKPKLQNHFYSCHSHSFTCVDCCQTFDRNTAKNHNTCVSEHEKYALGATKPGGAAANGVQGNGAPSSPAANSSEPTGLEFLSNRPPWKCSVCNVSCTSRETLMSHAAGVKHKRKARAALNAQNGGSNPPQNGTTTAAANTAATTQGQQGNGTTTEAAQQGAQEQGTGAATKASQNGSSHAFSEDQLQSLVKIIKKKLTKKGKVGPNKLRKLAIKKLSVKEDELDGLLLTSLREKIVAMGAAKVDGKKLLPA